MCQRTHCYFTNRRIVFAGKGVDISIPFADLKNTGSDAGAISAALFLQEFVPENTAWAHLDIAGTAFVSKSWKYTEYGATGFGVQTLIELAREMANET